ncbi:ectonucleotide pyrophosphatase/phosphodiesterase family member 1 [Delitschia confertaspora ATCC 74209]|uniref:Ectonucleotide pyrophosphatase/phosphodiesterase family member 1 n=1 Tax=Delitschia confertaspora ATCC 74209 TaxID=1513339 RepID=A0A9P4JI48_9PLEO|nr:ectonucleotide pyrophosphatase/phosphodiesterase family member 1 [Delitschia confertaspora ATCC 74209]
MSIIPDNEARKVDIPPTFSHSGPFSRLDGNSEDEGFDDGRPSGELSDSDHDILEEEEERERLLTTKEGMSGLFKEGVKVGKRDQPARSRGMQRGNKRKSRHGESSHLMYEMEEGVAASGSSLSRNSSESDERRLLATLAQGKGSRTHMLGRTAIYSIIMVFFIILLYLAYRVSNPKHTKHTATLVSNGTSLFAPTTILISLDGFRADFLYRGLTPTLNKFIENGISPKYMLPSFPSVTFPNHYTMATGLYPEAHGVVGNKFWDPSLKKQFYYTHPDQSMQPFWWGGEPLWVTAEKQDVRVAVHMWPGSEAHIGGIEPAYVDKYNGSEVLPLKVSRLLGLLDLPGPEDPHANANSPRPQLIAAYVPNVDGDGHKYGPNSTEIRQTIKDADGMLESLLHGLEQRNLTDIVNVVVVSDHGMATTDVERLIQLEDLVDPNELSHIDGWPLYGLRPKKDEDLERLYQQLKEKTTTNPNIEVYLRDKDMPERYHFSNNKRIAPLWIVPKTGWAIVTKDEFDIEEGKKNGDVYHPRGLHGYDFEHPLMRAIFVARGPAFPHKPNSRMEPFQNIELYNIICDSLSITPAPNNGTLRLPLKPVGLHTDPETPPDETPADPVETSSSPSSSALLATISILPSISSIVSLASGLEETSSWEQLTEIESSIPSPVIPKPAPVETKVPEKEGKESWWEWLTHKADGIEEWVEEFVHGHTPTAEAKPRR